MKMHKAMRSWQSDHESPAFRQRLAQDMIEQDPALRQLRNENPALFDLALQMACVEAEHASPTFQTSTLGSQDREAIQRVSVTMVSLLDYS
jgi:hypothetical protein